MNNYKWGYTCREKPKVYLVKSYFEEILDVFLYFDNCKINLMQILW